MRLLAIAAAALLLRLMVRLASHEPDFFQGGYSFLFELAQSMASGRGYAFAGLAVYRVPMYPLFLAAVTLGREAFFPLAIAQATVAAGTVFLVGVLTRELFADDRAALIAASIAAIYPYYVVHDTALQDTALFTLLTLLSVLLLIRARRTLSPRVAGCAGLALAAAVLTRSTLVPFAIAAPIWLMQRTQRVQRTQRFNSAASCARVAAVCAATLALGVAPWLVRSYLITGVPVLESDTGARLWDGNSPYTFARYPIESIDLSKADAIAALTPSELADLGASGPNEVLEDRWFMRRALIYMREHPGLTVVNGFRKIGAAFSVLPSPRRSVWPTLAYAFSYGPIMILGLIGMALHWRSWREHSVIYLLFASFMLVTFVVFGHTSHRVFLDVYWMAFAASALVRLKPDTTIRLASVSPTGEP